MEPVKKGDRIRILQDGLHAADVLAGDVLEVTGHVSPTVFITESPRNPAADGWWIGAHSRGEGWELVQEGEA